MKKVFFTFPDILGLLSFREGPLLFSLFKIFVPKPDIIFLDGRGIAHPRGIDLRSNMGLLTNKPTIDCAKSKLIGSFDKPEKSKGAGLL